MLPSRLLRTVRSPKLPRLPISMPTTGPFAVDSAGMARPPSHDELVARRDAMIRESTPITKDHFWSMPIHEGLKHIAKTCSYHVVAGIIMEHSMFTLFDDMLLCHDAPLPHVIYTDLLQCKTYASLQSPMDEQFALPTHIIRSLLQMASFHLLHDPHYFASVEKLFRTMELQQTVGSEMLSAWVQCCIFAGKTALGIETLERMEANGIAFDAEVFCSMMSPTSVGPRPDGKGDPNVRLAHNRLHAQLSSSASPSAVGVHAAFVANSLLMRHAAKWEVVRLGLSHHSKNVSVCPRTLDLAAAVLTLEGGARCGPKTNEALAVAYAQQGNTEALFKTLYCMRSVEQLPQYVNDPMTTFSDAALDAITVSVKATMERQPEKRMQGSSSLYLLDHNVKELHHVMRPDGPLATSIEKRGGGMNGEALQFKELLSWMNYDKIATTTAPLPVGGADAAMFSQSLSTAPVSEVAAADQTIPSAVAPLPNRRSLLEKRNQYLTTSRLAQKEATDKAQEAWARARMASAWMNPDTVLP